MRNTTPHPAGRHTTSRRRARPKPPLRAARLGAVALAASVTAVTVAAALVPTDGPDRTPQRVPSSAPSPAASALTRPVQDPTRSIPPAGDLVAGRSAAQRGSTPPEVPEHGTGRFAVAGLAIDTTGGTAAQPSGMTYTVEVERGLPFAPSSVAAVVDGTLADSRGWRHQGRRLLRVAKGDIRVLLASPDTTDALCAPLRTRGRVSCRNGPNVVLNAWRWANGVAGYRGDLAGYRRYMVNHEVGHALGHPRLPCLQPGSLAPVMLQQTLGLDGCRPKPWPSPAAKGTR